MSNGQIEGVVNSLHVTKMTDSDINITNHDPQTNADDQSVVTTSFDVYVVNEEQIVGLAGEFSNANITADLRTAGMTSAQTILDTLLKNKASLNIKTSHSKL